MNKENLKTKITFPENTGLIVEEILKKYGLLKTQMKKIEEIMHSRSLKESEEIFENLPGTKISKLVKEYAEGKVPLEKTPERLEKKLNISNKEACQIAKDLEEKLLVFIKPVKRKKASSVEISSTGDKKRTNLVEKPISQKPDTYREPIE